MLSPEQDLYHIENALDVFRDTMKPLEDANAIILDKMRTIRSDASYVVVRTVFDMFINQHCRGDVSYIPEEGQIEIYFYFDSLPEEESGKWSSIAGKCAVGNCSQSYIDDVNIIMGTRGLCITFTSVAQTQRFIKAYGILLKPIDTTPLEDEINTLTKNLDVLNSLIQDTEGSQNTEGNDV